MYNFNVDIKKKLRNTKINNELKNKRNKKGLQGLKFEISQKPLKYFHGILCKFEGLVT